MARTFEAKAWRRARVIAGDFNIPRCKRNRHRCRLTSVYRIATRKFGYRDAVSSVNGWSSAIDYIFSKAPVVDAGVDRTRDRAKRRYSDHVFRWALVEKRDTTAPSDPGRITVAKGNRDRVRLRGWKKKVLDGGTGFSHFDIRRSRKGPDRGFRKVGSTRKTMFRDRKVAAGVKYWYKVIAYDRTGNRSGPSNVVGVRAGKPPRDHGPDRGRSGGGKGPHLDGPLVPDVERPAITGPDIKPPPLHISGPQLDPPKPAPAIDPPPIKP
jgi:hypothetical protein